jgi:arylsulfatase A-like enzyme
VEGEKVNLHDVGHNKGFGKLTAEEIRFAVRRQHMSLVDIIIARLKQVPEGSGTLFDNTMIFYFPDNGETHHSQGTEFPFVVLSGKNAKLNLRGQYLRLPNYGNAGHKTLGNWYTALLNAYGNPIKHYGDIDPGLTRYGIDQTGPIEPILA